MLLYEVLKIRDFRKLLRLLFATPQKLLRDPTVGNHCSKWKRNLKYLNIISPKAKQFIVHAASSNV